MIWGLYFILSFVCMVVCYITNPIVVLFADETGEFHGFLKYWQTWDDSLDPEFCAKQCVPKFLQYDYDKHYEEYKGTTPELERVGRERWFVKLKDPNFTLKERIQRYFCRVIWLTRNCSYGFSFWMLGKEINPKDMTWVINDEHTIYGYDATKPIWTRPWVYKTNKHWFWKINWEVFCGWKIGPGDDHLSQCMIANRVTIRFEGY